MPTCSTCGHELEELRAMFCSECGSPIKGAGAAGVADGPGLVDQRYQPERELGRGSMGVVYLARDIHLGRPVALKMVTPDLARSPKVVALLQREASALATVRSEHVVQVYAFGPHEGAYFFAMEFVKGPSLESIIDDYVAHDARVPVERALTVLRQVAAGLDAVHRAGLVHRDVKPGNIVVEERTGRAVLVDFGLALPSDQRASAIHIGGTPAFMAPEQATDAPLTPRADVYALACTAFELLTGRLPFDGTAPLALIAQHQAAERPRASSVVPEAARFDLALMRGMSIDPEHRPATCGDFVTELTTRRAIGVSQAPAPLESQRRVLVVDDDPAFVRFATRAVGFAFFGVPLKVVACSNGEDAVTQATAAMPHLVLLDYDMPGLNGFETLSRLRDLPRGADARILVVSATVGRSQTWRFGVLGVDDFLSKPVELPVLVSTIQRLAARSGWASSESVSVRRPSASLGQFPVSTRRR